MPPGTPWHDGDIDLIHRLGAVGVMLPKAEDPDAVAGVAHRLRGPRPVIPLIETALGIHRAVDNRRRAWRDPACLRSRGLSQRHRLRRRARGACSLRDRRWCWRRVSPDLPRRSTGRASTFVTAAKTTEESRHARMLGFGGKLCIHPNQVAWVQRRVPPQRRRNRLGAESRCRGRQTAAPPISTGR